MSIEKIFFGSAENVNEKVKNFIKEKLERDRLEKERLEREKQRKG